MYAQTWYAHGYQLHVLLTPKLGQFVPVAEFKKLESEWNINAWLDTKGFKINHIIVHAELVTINNITYMREINLLLGKDIYPLNAPTLLQSIKMSLTRQWVITVNKTKYLYTAQFEKYVSYIQNGKTA